MESIKLADTNNEMLFIPEGFAHGFLVISETAKVLYKTSNYYHPQSDKTLLWNDKDLNIDWGLKNYNISSPIISKKDLDGFSLLELKTKSYFF